LGGISAVIHFIEVTIRCLTGKPNKGWAVFLFDYLNSYSCPKNV